MARKIVLKKVLIGAWLTTVLSIALVAIPINLRKGPSHDFLIYVGEAECVTNGMDPYDVWSGKVQSERYYPYEHPERKTETRCMPIHGHTPWSYVCFLPFAGDWPLARKWIAWQALCILCIGAVAAVAFSMGHRMCRNPCMRTWGGGGGYRCRRVVDWRFFRPGYRRELDNRSCWSARTYASLP